MEKYYFFCFCFLTFFSSSIKINLSLKFINFGFFSYKKMVFCLFLFWFYFHLHLFLKKKKKKKRLVVHSFVRLAWPYQDEIWSNHSPTNDFYSKINKLLIKTLSKEGSDRSSFGHIIKDCKSIMGLLKTCFFSLVKRKGNGLPMP